ncbi:Dam family site-specific DNA-(adenine-N6)-methyltransferase [Mesorhizobium sp.]|uniref:DNA adenine methylase n=1 Tax=Mesorhizobium sp. TaxID=1871066 RepID=UPI00257BC499|nr:Dam family site-specific DNA-(adenine-N6)-methyltransferase [Mesorhizobium sp.]
MALKPFLKWAGGKRWLIDRDEFCVPEFSGAYIEPFLGGAAIFFHLAPTRALLSDSNPRLIESYQAIRDDWVSVWEMLNTHQRLHSSLYYYEERSRKHESKIARAAQFIYLNRACWNGLYRENLKGDFNVPIGTKTAIVASDDDFASVAELLSVATIKNCDFQETIEAATEGDFLFVDPPYTTAHNFNGFVKYNQRIFNWDDQIRLRDALAGAASRGCEVLVTNADHSSISELYDGIGHVTQISRASVISGKLNGRKSTTEKIIRLGPSAYC